MELKDLDPSSPYKIKSLKNLKILFHLPSGQDVLSSPQQTGCGPSLANGVHPVSARHLGDSFPVNLPQEAVLQPTNDTTFSPPCLCLPPFAVHKKRSLASDTTFLICTSVLSICNDAKHERLEYMCITDMEDPQVGSFLIFLSLYFDLLLRLYTF